MLKKLLATTALLLGTTTVASAASVSIVKDLTGPYVVPAISSFVTTGAEMGGMYVTATFADTSTSTVTWAATGSSTGGGSNSLFSINSGSGTTYTSTWTLSNLTNQSLTSLFLSGPAGNTLFDTTNPNTGTEGSAQGRNFVETSNLGGSVVATYSGVVGLPNAAPLTDLFAFLTLNLTGLTGGGLGGTSMTFRQDTDNGTGGPITTVPVPAAGFLLLGALGGFGVVGRRRRRKAV